MPPFQKLKTLSNTIVQHVFSVLLTLLFVTYPFLVYFGLYHFEPRVLYAILGGFLVVRFALKLPRLNTQDFLRVMSPLLAVACVVLLGLTTNSQFYMLFLPALITLSLAAVFGYSLYSEPSMVETFARMEIPDLTQEDRDYCWDVTLVWVIFMLLNSGLVVFLAVASNRDLQLAGYDPLAVWTIYTGVISYVLVGLLFGLEFLYRKWKFRRFQGSLLDRMLREMIPPRGSVVKTFIPLDKLNIHTRRTSYPVSREDGDYREWQNFNSLVAGLKSELSGRNGQDWVLDVRSGFAFCVGLFGIWQSGGRAILPPSERPETLSSITADADGVVTGRPDAYQLTPVIEPLEYNGDYNDLSLLDVDRTNMRLYTSGSSGRSQAVHKTLHHLQSEVRILEENWSTQLASSSIISTVSHQHIYGLLYKILWPLSAGRSFESLSITYPDDLLNVMTEYDSVSLVTTPTHLEKFVEHEEFSRLESKLRVVFSSGGPLARETAERVHERIGLYPYEILGSTETGGVAWRQQDTSGDNLWTPFKPVRTETSTEGTLKVKSPWVSEPDGGWHDMRDRVEFRDGERFVLKGRADRVENIADKRVDLPELEERAEAHESIAEAAAVVLEESSETSTRRRMKMVVVTEDNGDDELIDDLRKHLLEYFEAVVIPREILVLDELPRNSEGKVTVNQLKKTFRRENASSR